MLTAPLSATDRVVLAYDLTLVPLTLLAQPTVRGWEALLAFHLALPPVVIWLCHYAARADARPFWRFMRRWYPLLLLMVLYPEAGLLRHVFVPADLDPVLARFDAVFFPGEPHLWAMRNLPVAALELVHAVYFSYYLLLFVPALCAVRRAPDLVERFIYTLVVSLLAHYLLAIALPTSGPWMERAAEMPRGWLFLPLMRWIYAGFDRGGLAFPSTHAAAGVVCAVYAGRFFPRHRLLFWTWGGAVAVSTVLCAYHYTIDTVVGVVTGLLSLWLWGREPAGADLPPVLGARSQRA